MFWISLSDFSYFAPYMLHYKENYTALIIQYIFFFYFTFLEQFQVSSKIREKVQRFPTYPCPYTCIAFLIINISHQSDRYICYEPSLTGPNHPEFTLGIVNSKGLGKSIITCIHVSNMYHFSIIQSIFPALKILCASIIHPVLSPQLLVNTDRFYHLHSFAFSRMS